MERKILVLSLLAMSLTAPPNFAQTPPAGTTQPAENAVAAGAIQALKDMGTNLQTLKRFQVTNDMTGERVLQDGEKLQHSARAELDVDRPTKIRVKMSSPRSQREIIFDGNTVTLYTPAQKYYSSAERHDTIAGLIKVLQDKYGVEMPLADLFLWGTDAAPLDTMESAMNAGQDIIGNDLCDHYAFRQGNIDWQIWITADGKPLPRKIVITNRADEARPQSVSLLKWNLNPTFTDSVFKFAPPKGSTKIEILPVKAK
jgi:hypothetical protein